MVNNMRKFTPEEEEVIRDVYFSRNQKDPHTLAAQVLGIDRDTLKAMFYVYCFQVLILKQWIEDAYPRKD